MNTIEFWNRKVRQLTVWDLKLAQLWSALWILLLAKIFPQIMQLSVWWFVAGILLGAPRLIYVFFIRKDTH
jgi:hypothetical protein